MSFWNPFSKPYIRCGQPEWHGLPFEVSDECIPEAIRIKARARFGPEIWLYFTNTKEGGEWWVLDEFGDIAEAYWLE
jgi:hypothetical protein